MKNISAVIVVGLSLTFLMGCKSASTDLSVLAAAVPNSGPRDGNNYKVFVKVLRGTPSTPPAVGFNVEAWVKGKGDPQTLVTDKNGIAKFENLPFPDARSHLNISFHYYKGPRDQSRSINYPYLDTDAYRMKDTQYIPEDAMPEPQEKN